jgi:heme A synthase
MDANYGVTDRIFSGGLLAAMIVQLTLGALVRHRVDSMVLLHIIMAAGVTLLALACGFRAWAIHREHKALRRTGLAVIGVVLMQLTLGILALVMRPVTGDDARTTGSALWTTAHQANGAILLALCAVLHVWNMALLKPRDVLHAGDVGFASGDARMAAQS